MLIILLLVLSTSILSAYLAKNKNRNPIAWFFLAFFLLGIFALLLVALLPKKELPQQKVALNNSNESVSPAGDEFEEFAGNVNQEKIYRFSTSKLLDWYLIDEKGVRAGPMNYAAMRLFIREQSKPHDTYVWCTEIEDWMQIKDFINTEILFDTDFD